MTVTELMDNLAEKIRAAVEEYRTPKKSGDETLHAVEVYAGYPPIRTDSSEIASFIYALVISTEDKLDMPYGTAQVEIGFNIFDDDTTDGWRSLYNLMEHVRQALLRDRCIKARNSLELPLKMEIVPEQAYPQWQGKIMASYSIGQPAEEEFNVGYY